MFSSQLLCAPPEWFAEVGYKIHVSSRDSAPCLKNASGGYLLLPQGPTENVFREDAQQGRAVSCGTPAAVAHSSQVVMHYKYSLDSSAGYLRSLFIHMGKRVVPRSTTHLLVKTQRSRIWRRCHSGEGAEKLGHKPRPHLGAFLVLSNPQE